MARNRREANIVEKSVNLPDVGLFRLFPCQKQDLGVIRLSHTETLLL